MADDDCKDDSATRQTVQRPSRADSVVDGQSGPPRPLYARLETLDLTMRQIEDAGLGTAQSLEHACRHCATGAKCEQDLEQRPEATDWRRTCPNASIFETAERLKKMQN